MVVSRRYGVFYKGLSNDILYRYDRCLAGQRTSLLLIDYVGEAGCCAATHGVDII